jgi:FkbM family methyltransferase
MTVIQSTLRSGELFVDVGANIGIHSLAAAAVGAEVVAFEPDLHNQALIAASVCLNGFESLVRLYPVGLGVGASRDCRLLKPLANIGDGETDCDSGRCPTGSRPPVQFQCTDFTVDEMSRYLPRQAAMMKLDVEGFEQHAILGGLAAFRRDGAPKLIVTECLARAAAARGQSTLFWQHLRREFSAQHGTHTALANRQLCFKSGRVLGGAGCSLHRNVDHEAPCAHRNFAVSVRHSRPKDFACVFRWYERLPVVGGWVDWVVLATCSGANIRLVCSDDPRFTYSL